MANTIRNLIDQKSAEEFRDELTKQVERHSVWIMALIEHREKIGKCCCQQPYCFSNVFPPCEARVICYCDLTMDHTGRDTISAKFPTLTDQEASDAADNFDAYLTVIILIYDRISADPQTLAELRAALATHRDGADTTLTDREESLSM